MPNKLKSFSFTVDGKSKTVQGSSRTDALAKLRKSGVKPGAPKGKSSLDKKADAFNKSKKVSDARKRGVADLKKGGFPVPKYTPKKKK